MLQRMDGCEMEREGEMQRGGRWGRGSRGRERGGEVESTRGSGGEKGRERGAGEV